MADTQVKSCEECGASVYPEHVNAGKAGLWGGKQSPEIQKLNGINVVANPRNKVGG